MFLKRFLYKIINPKKYHEYKINAARTRKVKWYKSLFEAEIKKDLGNDWIGTAGYGSDDNTFALGLRKEWKSGGLLDRKRLK